MMELYPVATDVTVVADVQSATRCYKDLQSVGQ